MKLIINDSSKFSQCQNFLEYKNVEKTVYQKRQTISISAKCNHKCMKEFIVLQMIFYDISKSFSKFFVKNEKNR